VTGANGSLRIGGTSRTISSFHANGCRDSAPDRRRRTGSPAWAGNRDLFFDVEQQQLVAAEHQAGLRILRADRSDVEAADRVLAAEEQLLEDRQRLRSGELVDVLALRAHAEREAAGLFDEPDAFEHRPVEVRVAAETRGID
jgi:hypothetical protein